MLVKRQELIEHLQNRILLDSNSMRATEYLKEHAIEEYLDEVISVIYVYTRRTSQRKLATFAEVICAIGFTVRNRYSYIRCTASSAKLGAFILYSFEEMALIRTFKTKGKNSHATFVVEVANEQLFRKLYLSISPKALVETLPSTVPYEPWKRTVHPTGSYLVKTTNKSLNKVLTSENYPVVFSAINKSQAIGWRVNSFILDVQLLSLETKAKAFDDVWLATSEQARQTKKREAKTITGLAVKWSKLTFYHMFYLDFRGRMYPATAYLHHQGSDVARGLLLRSDKKRLGKHGYKWLLIYAANTWGGDAGRSDGLKTDKLPLNLRADWAAENLATLKSYAEKPFYNDGWMSADKPWQFLAVCNELKNIYEWVSSGFEIEDYESNLECFIDGTCNGHQHLAALSRDSEIAKYVNLTKSEWPGDLYSLIAKNTWAVIETAVQRLSPARKAECEAFIHELKDFKERITAATPQERMQLTKDIVSFKNKNKTLMEDSCPVFWSKITSVKERRKVLKRNVMTIPYGASGYGLGEQIIEDSKKYGIPWLFNIEFKLASYLGRLTYETCEYSLRRSIKLLRAFENCGKYAEEAGQYLSWNAPLTGFPVIQHYVEGKVKKAWIQYGPKIGPKLSTRQYANTYQIMLSFLEEPVPSKRKQAQGAAPNIIHSLDAAHLSFTIASADFPITTIHDSFGCLAGDMEELYKHVREVFVFLYLQDPLTSIGDDINLNFKEIDIGDFDVNEVLDSEYAFS